MLYTTVQCPILVLYMDYRTYHYSFTCREEVAENGDNDFVFEEFVRLRVAGVEDGNNETEA